MTDEGKSTPQLIEQIAGSIMTADLDDLSRLGAICTALELLIGETKELRPAAAALATALNGSIEALILDDYGQVDDPLDMVARGIALLQRMQTDFERTGEDVADDAALYREIAEFAGIAAVEETEGAAGPGGTGGLTPEAMVAVGLGATPGEEELLSLEDGAEEEEEEDIPEVVDVSALDEDLFTDFTSEAEEHLAGAETALLSLETSPQDAELLNTVFRSFHTIKGAAGFMNLEAVVRVAHSVEDVLDAARKEQLVLSSAILDVVLASIDLLRGLLLDVGAQLEGRQVPPRGASAFVARVVAVRLGKESPTPLEISPSSPATPDAAVAPPAAPAAGAVAGRNGDGKSAEQHYVRVGTGKLDQLVNMVGELVITQTQVAQNRAVEQSGNQKLGKDISQLAKVSKDIQEISMSLRMVPIRGTFERMARIVRDLARKCGKEVELRTSGEDTELDKNVVEELVDPLTHMVRNAVDHGVESPEVREAGGKPRKGVVGLRAYHQGGSIVIELSDDGKGIDRDKLLAKAVERGLARAGEELSDKEVNNFIFMPGVSTAREISDISGRGVGMDVVRRSIEGLRGKTEVDSEPGRGSTITIRLPLTLAIIDGMVVGVGDQRYILPLVSIVRSLRPQPEDVATVIGQGEMVKVEGELHPLVRLHEQFSVTPHHTDPSESLVVLVDAEAQRYCLLVDELVGIQQVVIKALEENLRSERCLSGCAILGDGQVGLILDPSGLAPKLNSNYRRSRQTATALATG